MNELWNFMADLNLEKSIEILERTSNILKAMVQNLSADWIYANEGGETWSIFEVIVHFVHSEKTNWIPRIEIILSEKSDKGFPPFDRFAEFEASKNKSLAELLEEFETLRRKNLDVLRAKNISGKDLESIGIHPSFGEVTLSQLLATWTVHDLDHLSQITRIIAKQYKTAVGPWVEYLKILNVN